MGLTLRSLLRSSCPPCSISSSAAMLSACSASNPRQYKFEGKGSEETNGPHSLFSVYLSCH